MRKREILGPDFGGVLEVLPGDMRERPLEIDEVFFGETNGPATGVGELVACPYIRSRYRLGENLGHRRRSFAAYAAAAAQLYGWTAKITAGVPVPAWHTHGTRQASPWLGMTSASEWARCGTLGAPGAHVKIASVPAPVVRVESAHGRRAAECTRDESLA